MPGMRYGFRGADGEKMTRWTAKRNSIETTLKIETFGGLSEVTVSSKKTYDGESTAHDKIRIPLETLKEMVNAQ